MDTEELRDFIIQERLSLYFRSNIENSHEENKRNEEFVNRLMEIAPGLEKEYLEYMDWLALHSSKEQKGIYLFGVHDGIQLIKSIMDIE